MYSRKNGVLFSNSVAKVESNANWITITAQDRPAFTVAINSDSASRDGIITLTQKESGNTCQIKVHQAGASVEEWRYTLVVTPTVVNFSSSGGSQSVTVESFRELYVNGVYQSGSKEFVNWSSSEYIAWASTVDNQTSLGTYKGTCTITAIANSTTSDRSGEVLITQSDMSGTSSTVRVTQAAKVEDVYVFTWGDGSETSIPTEAVANAGGFTIGPPKMPPISTKNGATHGYSVTSKPSWLEVRLSDTLVVDLTKNTSPSSRSGSIVLTQDGSGKTLTITISQKGYAYEFQWVNGGVVESPDVMSYTYTTSPGSVFDSTSIMNTLVSTRSMDDWTNNAEKVDVTVIDTPEISWLTVTVDDYGVAENPGLMDVKLSGTVPDTPGTTYTVQFLQHESAKVCLLKIVVESKVQNLIVISSANYDGKYNVYFQAADPVASDVQITYTLIKTGANGNTNAVTMRTGQRVAGVIGLEVTRNDYEAVRIEFVSPQSDSTYAYTYSAATVPINYPVDVSASCRFYGSFGTMASSDSPMIIPLASVVNFDGSTSSVASYLKIPTEYNQESVALQLDGDVSFNVEANNNTTNSMKSIEVELLYSTTESDVGTDYGALISSWIENYPVGGKYITVEVQNATVNSSLLDVTDHNTPIYLWFNVKVVYEGWDNPMISCTTSSINFTLTSR